MGLNEIFVRRIRASRDELSERDAALAVPAQVGELRTKIEEYNALIRRRIADLVDSIGLIPAGEAPQETLLQNNNILLARGAHGGKTLLAEDTHMAGIGPGAVMDRQVIVRSDAVFDNVTFSQGSGDPLSTSTTTLIVGTSGTVVARNCIFEMHVDNPYFHVVIQAGGKAVFIGCVFRGGAAAPLDVIRHSGAAADVQVAYCHNKTPRPLANPAFVTLTGNI